MADLLPSEALSEDRLLGGRVVVRQPKEGFRAAIDTVLLATAVPAAPGESVLELGAGGGAAALCLAVRVAGCRVCGVERAADLVALAKVNARLNRCEDRVSFAQGDVAAPAGIPGYGAFDHAMANPPHLPPARAAASPVAGRAQAAVEGAAGLGAWIAALTGAVRRGGSVTLIHRADRLDDILGHLAGAAGAIVVFPLWPGPDRRPARRVIVQARRGVGAPLRLARGLVLHGAGGGFTAAADAALRGAPLSLRDDGT